MGFEVILNIIKELPKIAKKYFKNSTLKLYKTTKNPYLSGCVFIAIGQFDFVERHTSFLLRSFEPITAQRRGVRVNITLFIGPPSKTIIKYWLVLDFFKTPRPHWLFKFRIHVIDWITIRPMAASHFRQFLPFLCFIFFLFFLFFNIGGHPLVVLITIPEVVDGNDVNDDCVGGAWVKVCQGNTQRRKHPSEKGFGFRIFYSRTNPSTPPSIHS